MVDDKFPWEIDDFQPLEPELHGRALVALYMAIDDIIVGLVFVHQVRESCLDARTLLVDGIIKRVRQAIHCFCDFIGVDSVADFSVEGKQFLTMIHQVLELYSFRVIQKEQIEGLMDGTEQHLPVSIVREQETVIPAEPPVNKPKSWTLGGRIKKGLKKIAEDLDIITYDDENYK